MKTFLLICGGGYHENYAWTFFFCSSVFVSVCVFNVWPKTTLPLPVWSRDAKRLDTPVLESRFQRHGEANFGKVLVFQFEMMS